MIQIEALVRKSLPELCGDHVLSFVCLSTSNPVYLVFFEKSYSPELVVRFSRSEDICHAHKITEQLYKILGDLIPEPLALIKSNDQNISIQKGVQGTPWFQLAEKYCLIDQRQIIHVRAIAALNQFQRAVALSPGWVKVIRPYDELRQSYRQCVAAGTILPVGTEILVERFCQSLEELGEISSFPQHGDFCLNNLIIGDTKMHVIDFEDFGITLMPFFDQFTLALSFYQLASKAVPVTLNSVIRDCLSEAFFRSEIDVSFLPGLFMYHLLLRLGAWSQNRLEYRRWLLVILEDFSKSPDALFQGVYE